MIDPERGKHGFRDAVDLRQAAGSKRGEDGSKCKKASQHRSGFNDFSLPGGDVHPFFHVIHGSTRDGTIRKYIPVFVRNGHLHKFRGHTQHRGNKHPEEGGRTAQVNGQGHSSNISCSYCTRQSRG